MRRKSIEIDSEVTQMMDLVNKDIIAAIIHTPHMFKELEESMSMTKREMEAIKKDPSQTSRVEKCTEYGWN